MNEPVLWMLSINAFGAVLLLLSLLAGAIRLLSVVFPPPPAAAPLPRSRAPAALGPARGSHGDAALIAAIHAVAQQVLPGGRVTHVTELSGEATRPGDAS